MTPKIEQFHNKNQFVIRTKNNIYLQSYDSVVCKIGNSGRVTFGKDWDYSKTTTKHLYLFLQEYSNVLKGVDKAKKDHLKKLLDNGTILYNEEM